MRKILTILFLFFKLIGAAQDFTFSQFYEQPVLRNPALAGLYKGDLRVSSIYRDQWASITVPFRTTSLSVEYKSPVSNSTDFFTTGLQMSMDGAGDIRLKRTQLLPFINYHKSLSGERDSYLSVAFMGGPVFSQFDPTQIKFGDQYRNGGYSAANPTSQVLRGNGYNYWDLWAGISYSTVFNNQLKFYIASSIAHVNNPKIKSVISSEAGSIDPKYSFNIGINGKANDRDYITAFVDYFSQGGSRQIIGGLLYGFSAHSTYDDQEPTILYVGSFFRLNDAVIPVIKLSFNHYSMGISYDVNISKLNTVSNWRGGLELSMAYTNFLKIRSSTLDKVRCVSF